ncbi:MAG TPA: sodium ion-translocating decarboxylase subunit beta [Terriglobales bacterium]|nr:sodium ion-translocating decarboxylase subunit beta [Terriglobales bacterium]
MNTLLVQAAHIFEGLSSFGQMDSQTILIRLSLMVGGFLLIYFSAKNILDPMVLMPMGLAMVLVNGATLTLEGKLANLFVDPMLAGPEQIVNSMQIFFLQPIYNLMFSNGLIACLVFMGIGVITPLDYLIAFPLSSLLIAIGAELGTILTFPLAVAFGFTYREAASIAIVGGADGPMVIFTSLELAKNLFVPISVVAYVYLSITYAIYPYMVKLLVPKRLQGIDMDLRTLPKVSSRQKLIFAVLAAAVLSLLFPVAAPLFASFFIGVMVREADLPRYQRFLDEVMLTGSTFFLGFVLGALFSFYVVTDSRVLLIMVLGLISILLSGLGGMVSGLIAYKVSNGKINPLIGIAGVSCMPSTAKVAQKCALAVNKQAIILPFAMGPSVAGVITTAILAGIYVGLLR